MIKKNMKELDSKISLFFETIDYILNHCLLFLWGTNLNIYSKNTCDQIVKNSLLGLIMVTNKSIIPTPNEMMNHLKHPI